MKKSSDKRNPHRFVPGLFTLESREVPAGNIQAFVANGVLTIRSDDDFHAFSISGAGGNNVVIRPLVGTTINGQTENIWVGGVRRGYDIQTGDGADSVIISGVNGRDYLSIVTNGGDDAVHIVHGTRSNDSTWVRTGDGDDVIIITDARHDEHFALLAGSGNDRVTVNNAPFGPKTTFDGGDGNDGMTITNSNFTGQPANFEGAVTVPPTVPPAAPDTTAPTVILSSTSTAATNAPFTVTATFSEAVSGFSTSDIAVTNATLSNFATVSATTYTFLVSPTAQGSVSVTVNASAATDAANNASTASAALTRTFDTTAPTAAITTAATSPVLTSPIAYTVTFSEVVTGLAANDFTVTNGTIGNFASTSGSIYTFTIAPTLDGAVSVRVNAGAAQDAAGNSNPISEINSVTFNGAPPIVTFTAPSTTTKANTITVTAKFSEVVTGFTQDSLDVTNAEISNFQTVDTLTSTFVLTPSAEGAFTVTLPAGTVTDSDSRTNAASTLSITSDKTAPTITANAQTATTATPTLTGTVSEAGSTVKVTVNGVPVNAIVNGTNWSATLGILANGTYDIDVEATDAATNVATSTLADGLTVNVNAPADSGMVDVMPAANAPNWVFDDNNLGVWDTLVGTGAAVTSTSNISAYYTGWLTRNGEKFDDARVPESPLNIPLSNLIEGWKIGLIGMKVGGIRRLHIPSELAYGPGGQGSIGPNEDLIFEIKLVGLS